MARSRAGVTAPQLASHNPSQTVPIARCGMCTRRAYNRAMLVELTVRNFAVIEETRLSLADGFNVITGETGAGKSLLVDALEFVLGGPADQELIRAGAETASVEAVFAVDHAAAPHRLPPTASGMEHSSAVRDTTSHNVGRFPWVITHTIQGVRLLIVEYRSWGARLMRMHRSIKRRSLRKTLLWAYPNCLSSLQLNAIEALLNWASFE